MLNRGVLNHRDLCIGIIFSEYIPLFNVQILFGFVFMYFFLYYYASSYLLYEGHRDAV